MIKPDLPDEVIRAAHVLNIWAANNGFQNWQVMGIGPIPVYKDAAADYPNHYGIKSLKPHGSPDYNRGFLHAITACLANITHARAVMARASAEPKTGFAFAGMKATEKEGTAPGAIDIKADKPYAVSRHKPSLTERK